MPAIEIQPSYYIRIDETSLAQIDVCDFHDGYIVTRVIVPKNYRRKGYGNALMHNICTIGDKAHRTLYLQPLTYNVEEFPQRSIEEWYKKWGFKWYMADRSIMRRFPQNALASEVNKERGMGWPS